MSRNNNSNNNTRETNLSQLRQEENSVVDLNGNNTNNNGQNNDFNNHVKVNLCKLGISDDDDVSYESHGPSDSDNNNTNNNNSNTQVDIDLRANLMELEQLTSISTNNNTSRNGQSQSTREYYTTSKHNALGHQTSNNNNNNTTPRSHTKSKLKTNNTNGKGKEKKKDVDMNADDNANITSQALKDMENMTNVFLTPHGNNGNNTNDKNGDYGNNNSNSNLNKNNPSKKANTEKFHYRYGHDSSGINNYSNNYQHPPGYSQSQWNTRNNETPHTMFNNNSSSHNGNNERAYDRAARGSDEYGHDKYRFNPTRQPIYDLEMQNNMLSSTEMRDKALAQFAPLMFEKVLDGDTNVNETIFIIEVLRQIGIFDQIPSYDKNSFLQREIPFENIDLVHAIINQCLQYFMKKLQDIINEDNVDKRKQLQIIDIMTQISEIANEYVRDQGEHTQISWIYIIITVINNNVKTGTILADLERKKSNLETPGNKKVLLLGRNKKGRDIPVPHYKQKKRNNNNNNNSSN